MKVAIANDKGGYRLKAAIVKKLADEGYEVLDYGTQSPEESKEHALAGEQVALAVQSGAAERGILLCGTGMGVSLAANKHKGVYAAPVESVFAAKHCRLINDCNVMCIGGYILGEYMALEMADAFLKTPFADHFEEGRARYLRSQYERIAAIEDKNFR
ncbi:MAG: RpiB/LacA/LacB family sugar-phosphate isomerase [Eubacteriales bacterium]|nr:RpiB/LacA/LacB family sugar-phosphate isomerase [Eubacteriales bacterium]